MGSPHSTAWLPTADQLTTSPPSRARLCSGSGATIGRGSGTAFCLIVSAVSGGVPPPRACKEPLESVLFAGFVGENKKTKDLSYHLQKSGLVAWRKRRFEPRSGRRSLQVLSDPLAPGTCFQRPFLLASALSAATEDTTTSILDSQAIPRYVTKRKDAGHVRV
jgi:hypothetical protein